MDFNFIIKSMLQNKLQQMGLNIDLNNENQVKDLVTKMLTSNPQAKEMIKQNAWNFGNEVKDKVVEVIDNI